MCMDAKQTRQLVSGLQVFDWCGSGCWCGRSNALQVIEYLLTGDRRTSTEMVTLRHMKRLNLISIDHLADDSVYESH